MALACSIVGAIAAPPAALAGEYQLTSDCINGAPGQLFVASNTDTGSFTTTQTCPTSGAEYGGLHVGEVQGAASAYIGDGQHAEYTFRTVPGTEIAAISYRRYFGQFSGDADSIPALRDDSGAIVDNETCTTPLGSDSCSGGFDSVSVLPTTISGLSTSSLSFGLRCVAKAPSPSCVSSPPQYEKAWFDVYSAVITVDENTAPALGAVSGGITAGSWLRGTTTMSLASAADPSGIQTASVSVDGGPPIAPSSSAPPACDFGRPKPCADLAGTSWSIDTSRLADGQHTATATAANAAGVTASTTPISFKSDNTAPVGPLNLTSSVGTSWQTSESTQLTWTLPDEGSGSPITAAFVSSCDGSGQDCGPATPADTLTSTVVHPGPGAHVEKVDLEDAAGNINPSTATAVPFRFASSPPPAPTDFSSSASSWQSSQWADATWTPPPRRANDPPLEYGLIEVCASDGSSCGAPQRVGIAGGRVDLGREGELRLRAWDVDAAGLGDDSHSASQAAFYSAGAPTIRIVHGPAARSASRRFEVAFRSMPGGPAPVAATEWTLCQAAPCARAGTTRGTTLSGTVPGTGRWTLTLTPVDAAGVRGRPVTTSFVIAPLASPMLKLAVDVVERRLRLRISTSSRFRGFASITTRSRVGRRIDVSHRSVRVTDGGRKVLVGLPHSATSVRVIVRLQGSGAFRPARAEARAGVARAARR